jgi:hypothetical protein
MASTGRGTPLRGRHPSSVVSLSPVACCSVRDIHTRTALRNRRTQLTPQDLFNIQPKRANWDLKRDMTNRMAKLERRTNEAIATIFRESVSDEAMSGSSLYRRTNASSSFHPFIYLCPRAGSDPPEPRLRTLRELLGF